MKTIQLDGHLLKQIKGFPDYYISNHGDVASLKRGRTKLLTPSVAGDGSLVVSLYKDGQRRTKRIHRLIIDTWFRPVPRNFDVLHKDGDRENNCPMNLKLVPKAAK